MNCTIRSIEASRTHDLRQRVLRPTLDVEAMRFPGDEAAVHLGAFVGTRLIGIASFYEEAMPSDALADDWRLRGMAVDPSAQGGGVGSMVLRAGIAAVQQRGGARLWCNAREVATGFYTFHGFGIVSDRFDIEDIGPHFVMARPVRVTG